ncbi:Glutamate dehydrogenase, NAD-specific, partial [Parasponia andersonii]
STTRARTQTLQLFQLVLKLIDFGQLNPFDPLSRFLDRFLNLLLLTGAQLPCNLLILNGIPHTVSVVLKHIPSLHLLLYLLIFSLVLLSLLYHPLNLVLAQPPLVVCNRNLVLHASSFVFRRDIQNPISIDIEAHVDLRDPSWRRRNTHQLKCPQKVVVLGSGSLAFVDLNQNAGLVI